MDIYNNLLLMKKDKDTGFLIEEVGSYKIHNHIEYIDKIFLVEESDKLIINLTLTTKEIEEDWKFYGILDLYNEDVFSDKICEIEESTDDYNPKWVLKIQYSDNYEKIENLLNEILAIHVAELERIIPLINEEDYAE
jgi:hypothetical protein